MGLFSAHGRLSQAAAHEQALGRTVRAAIQSIVREMAAGLRQARLVVVAATNDARIVAVLLLLAAVALGLEMAASFHVI
jgi:voltage-gated potassium channel Kch